MGLFDFFKKSGPEDTQLAEALTASRKFAQLARVVIDKKSPSFDRQEAIEGLRGAAVPSAVAVLLLRRYTFTSDPTITDQEEKQIVFDLIVGSAKASTESGEHILRGTIAHLEKAEHLSWPLKILRALMDDDRYRSTLLTMLAQYDTEYIRNVEPKVQLLRALGELIHADVRKAMEPFLDDVNETVRFHAAEAIFHQADSASSGPVAKAFSREESVRVRVHSLDGLAKLAWPVPEDVRAAAAERLAEHPEFEMSASGVIARRG